MSSTANKRLRRALRWFKKRGHVVTVRRVHRDSYGGRWANEHTGVIERFEAWVVDPYGNGYCSESHFKIWFVDGHLLEDWIFGDAYSPERFVFLFDSGCGPMDTLALQQIEVQP